MTVSCAIPDAGLGIAVRLPVYLDCQARALGENGFEALTASPLLTATLSGAVAIFVASVGYRLILGPTPTLRDAPMLAVRLGVVLTLATSWPAFQTLVYRVSIETPADLTNLLLPSVGTSPENAPERAQIAYDILRLGQFEDLPERLDERTSSQTAANTSSTVPASSPAPVGSGFVPSPQVAASFVASSIGLPVAMRFAVGILVAAGPLAVIALLFDATTGLFIGWAGALVGATFAVLAAELAAAFELVFMESELARIRDGGAGMASVADPQAPLVIVVTFSLIGFAAIFTALKVGSGLQAGTRRMLNPVAAPAPSTSVVGSSVRETAARSDSTRPIQDRSRATVVADALNIAVRRDEAHRTGWAAVIAGSSSGVRHAADQVLAPTVPLGMAGRRTSVRRSGAATRRDSMR